MVDLVWVTVPMHYSAIRCYVIFTMKEDRCSSYSLKLHEQSPSSQKRFDIYIMSDVDIVPVLYSHALARV